MSEVQVAWLGRVPYGKALAQQRERRDAIVAGQAPEAIWLLEHAPVITTGRRRVGDLPSAAQLAEHGTELFHTERGGLATWHGPGQLVGYLLLDLPSRGLKVKAAVCAIEKGLIDWLAAQGVVASRRKGYPGVWVNGDKIAALGIHVRRGVTLHGFALNLCNDLAGFGLITPCGIPDAGVTTLQQLTGRHVEPASVAIEVAGHVSAALDITLATASAADYPAGVVGA